MKDPDFLAEAGKANMDIKPLGGEALQATGNRSGASAPGTAGKGEATDRASGG